MPRDVVRDEPEDNRDDGSHRHRRNLIAVIVTVTLVLIGLYLMHVLRNMADIQDCVMSGRTNCAPIWPQKK